MDDTMGFDWSTDQGIDPKMLHLNHMMTSMDKHSAQYHSPQEESLHRVPPSEQYLPSVGGSLPLNVSPATHAVPDLEMHMDSGISMGLNERPSAQDAFSFNGAIGMANARPSFPEKGDNGNTFHSLPSNNFAPTAPLMPWTNQTTTVNDYQVFGGFQPMMAQKFLPNASNRHQQDSKSGSSFSTMNDFTPYPETLETSQGPSPQRTSKAPASKAKIPRLRARATRPLHKRSPSLKAFSMTKKMRIGVEDTDNAGSSIKPPTTNTLEDLELEDAIELLKKKFQRSPFCSLSQLKADDLLNQLEQIAIDEKKYRPLQSDTTSSTQDSQSNSGLVDLEYASDDTSVLSSTPRLVATIDDSASEEVDHTESRQCKAHICDDDCESKPLFHSTYPGCLFATHSAADWRRHEETTKHWPQQAFMCVYCPVPPMATDLNPKCQFCHTPFTATVGAPTAHYLRCPPAQIRGKTFRRKDKLLAHIRNDHLHIPNPSQAAAAGEFQDSNPNWPRNCGFCEHAEHVFTSWNERMEHIAQHFQDGAKIANWRLPLPAPKDFRPSGTSSHRLDDDDSDDDNGPHGSSGLSQRKFTGKKTATAASSSSQRGQRSSGSRSNVPSSSGQRRRGNTPEELLDLAEQQMGDSLGARRKPSPTLERYLKDPEEPIPALQSQLDQLPSVDLSKDPQTLMIAKTSEQQYLAELQDVIVKQAQGVFQWAALVVLAIRYHNDGLSPREISQMLKEVPEELGNVYKHVLRKVTSKKYCREALRLMGWVCRVERPLTVTEMCFAMSLPETDILDPKSSLAEPELRLYDVIVRRIVSLSRGLVESKQHGKDQIVQFIHQSVNDFLLRDGLRFFDKTSGDLIGHGHHQLSLICANYMRIAEIDSSLAEFSVTERMSWAETRQTTRKEDMAYSLLGIFDVCMPLIYGEGKDSALKRLREEIHKALKGTQREDFSVAFSLSNVSEVNHFVAREEELAEIHEKLSSEGRRRTVVIHGLGGIGKTQLTVTYAIRHKDSYSVIFWLNIKDEDSVKQSFARVAKQISRQHPLASQLGSVDAKGDLDEVVDAVKAWLSLPNNTRWLMIYDNYDNPKSPGNRHPAVVDIQKFLPESYQGSVIATTRSSQVKIGHAIHVGKLEDVSDSLEFLSSTSGREGLKNNPDAIRLTQELDGLPLALATAGAYLDQVTISVSDYLRLYKESWAKLQKTSPELSSYEDRTLYSTWQISFEHAERRNTLSAQLLRLWAYFDNQDVWFELLQHRDSEDPDWIRELIEDELSFHGAMQVLSDHSLVEVEKSSLELVESQGYSIHRCVLQGPNLSDNEDNLLDCQQSEQDLTNQPLDLVADRSTIAVDDPGVVDVGETSELDETSPIVQRLLYPESTCASCNAPLDTSEELFNPISPNVYCTRNRSPGHLSLRCVHKTCGRKFQSLAHLKTHFKEEYVHDSFNCAIPGCGVPLKRWQTKIHFLNEHEDVKYHCAQCGTGFDTIGQLDGHGKDTMHSAYVCRYPECGSESTRSGEMNRHHLSHRQSVPRHPCPHCRKYRGDNGFKRKDHLHQHIRNYHHIDADAQEPNTDESAGHPCTFEGCDKTDFETEKLMKIHLKKEPGSTLSLASDLNDSILVLFAQQAASGAPRASPIRQIAHSDSSSSSAEGTGPEEADSGQTELDFEPRRAVGTPATSDASEDADNLGFAQGPYAHLTGVANRDFSLAGLDLPEYGDGTFLSDSNDESDDIIDNINKLHIQHTRLQASPDAIPWSLGGEDARWLNPDGIALAPSPGPACVAYHLRMGKYTQRHHKIQRLWQRQTIQGSREAQPTPLESCGEPTDLQWDISSQVSTEWSLACNEPRGKQSQDFQDIHIKRVSGTGQQPMIPRSVDCVSYSLETLVSIFHPTFLVSHLSRSSVSTLTTELYAPEGLAYESEHALTFDLGFGPPIPLDVCPFTPIDNTALRSYQKHEGKDTLVVQESLPIALNLFSLESHAEDLDIWLDKIIDSEYWLPQYVALMIHQEKDSHFSHALSGLISWYMGSEDRLSEQEDQIVRPALKLLITTTLLGLVPEVSDLPASLFDYLCSQSPAQDTPQLSLVAPRLLTRQTKASLYYLQELFLSSIFYDFSYSMQLDADVQNALAFLVAYVLDLVRNAGREFASYSMEFKSAFPVTSRHVSEYEKNAETQLFEKVWARVASGNGRVGGLAERWRNLDSSVKGKENESDEHRFACAILDAVL